MTEQKCVNHYRWRGTFQHNSTGAGAQRDLPVLTGQRCHLERSEGSHLPAAEILRCAQKDSAVLTAGGV